MKATKKIVIFAAIALFLVAMSTTSCRRCGGCPTWEMQK